MKLDVIIPVYNEEGNVKLLHKKLSETLIDLDYELIFINDGSIDKTADRLANIYEEDKNHVKVINFSRNFGKDAAMYAGLTSAKAEYSVIIDGDCQQNPKYILTMLKYLEKNKNIDQVAMVNKERKKESFLNKILKKSFYKFINSISDTKFIIGASDFRMFRKNVVDAVISLGENNRFSKGIFSWVGFNTHYLEYEVEERNSGKTNFNLIKQFRYAFNGIINFSVKPLRIATVVGFITSIGSFIYLIIILLETLITGIAVPGYASLISIMLFLGGIQLVAIGILGEYISKTYLEAKKRPVYVTKNKLGFNEEIL
ncbi:MAG: glycosyltransferase family 2 protein [Bacilli bacterium]|nr:glycosyltransferase family 2 protein [Bacilli bacterium]